MPRRPAVLGLGLPLVLGLAIGVAATRGSAWAEEEPRGKGLALTEESLERWDADTEKSARNRYALIIGIEDYRDERISDLAYSEDDARSFYDTLVDPRRGLFDPKRLAQGAENYVRLLLGSQATTREVRKGLNWIARVAGPDDLVIVYFSGHGAKDFGETCWITWDAELDDLASTALPGSDIAYLLDKIQSRRLLVLVDCCHAADTVINELRGRRAGPSDSEEMARSFAGEGRVTISAAAGSQEAMESADLGHGVFTHLLCEALAGRADEPPSGNGDGWTSLQEVIAYVQGRVTQSARERGHDQKIVWESRGASRLDLFLLTVDPERRAQVRDEVRRRDEESRIDESRERLEGLVLSGDLPAELYAEFLRHFLAWRSQQPLDAKATARFAVLKELADGVFPPRYLPAILAWVSTREGASAARPESPEERIRRVWQDAIDNRRR